MRAAGSDHVLLDLTHLPPETIEHHFPTICARLRADGLDPVTTPIPVAPASHYLMGGIRTDLEGASSLPGLFAAGEAACTGVHGANRLASNSLLECLVFGRRAGLAAARLARGMESAEVRTQEAAPGRPEPLSPPPPPIPHSGWRDELAATMRAAAGPLRDGDGLRAGAAALAERPLQAEPDDADGITAANAALAARLIVAGALLREESRGGHFRADFPAPREAWRVHSVQLRGCPPFLVESVDPALALAHAAD
jgi:L-aspartate oxidase